MVPCRRRGARRGGRASSEKDARIRCPGRPRRSTRSRTGARDPVPIYRLVCQWGNRANAIAGESLFHFSIGAPASARKPKQKDTRMHHIPIGDTSLLPIKAHSQRRRRRRCPLLISLIPLLTWWTLRRVPLARRRTRWEPLRVPSTLHRPPRAHAHTHAHLLLRIAIGTSETRWRARRGYWLSVHLALLTVPARPWSLPLPLPRRRAIAVLEACRRGIGGWRGVWDAVCPGWACRCACRRSGGAVYGHTGWRGRDGGGGRCGGGGECSGKSTFSVSSTSS